MRDQERERIAESMVLNGWRFANPNAVRQANERNFIVTSVECFSLTSPAPQRFLKLETPEELWPDGI